MKSDCPLLTGFAALLATLLACAASAPAQNEQESEEQGDRQAWLMATSMPEGVESPLKILSDGELDEVRMFKRAMGNPVNLPDEGPLAVVEPLPPVDGEPRYEVLASVVVPPEVKQALIILVPSSRLEPPLRFNTRIVDLAAFDGGDAMFLNLTGARIGVTLGDKKASLKPGQLDIIRNNGFNGRTTAKVAYAHLTSDGQWNLISASTTILHSERREILVFTYNDALKSVDYHGLSFPVSDEP